MLFKQRLFTILLGLLFATVLTDQASALYDPGVGRFCSRDPIGYEDGHNHYVVIRTLSSMDPSGKIRIQPLRTHGSKCGVRSAFWDVFLDKPAPCDGYLIQEVTRSCFELDCPCDLSSLGKRRMQSDTYWEYWEITKGEIVANDRMSVDKAHPFTDTFSFYDANETCGGETVEGVFKFYCKDKKDSPNGEPGTGSPPDGTYIRVLCGRMVTSGLLKATRSRPGFWGDRPIESSENHTAVRGWKCCSNCPTYDFGAFSPGISGGNGWSW